MLQARPNDLILRGKNDPSRSDGIRTKKQMTNKRTPKDLSV